MRVFAIADLHLSGSVDKPMDIFGSEWQNHESRIAEAWKQAVSEDDLVLLPGDISWAMTIKEALCDFSYLGSLPGQKVIIRGNHDYWWNSLNKVRGALPPCVFALQNDCFSYKGVHVAGARGWICPGTQGFSEHDEKIYNRELTRLSLSVSCLPKDGRRIIMLHFPPFCDKRRMSGFVDIIKQSGAEMVVYGHLHAKACKSAHKGIFDDVEYRLVSADYLRFKPDLLFETD